MIKLKLGKFLLLKFRLSISSGGFSYSLSFELRFSNSLLGQAALSSQVQTGVDYYASQSSLIQSSLATNFPDYTLSSIDGAAIKNTILITSFQAVARTFTASFSNVLIMKSSSTEPQIDPSAVFGSLTTLVKSLIFKYSP